MQTFRGGGRYIGVFIKIIYRCFPVSSIPLSLYHLHLCIFAVYMNQYIIASQNIISMYHHITIKETVKTVIWPSHFNHHSIIWSFHHYIILSFHHSIIPSLHHSIIPSFHHSITTQFQHFIIPSLHHSIIPSLHNSIITQCHHSIVQSFPNSFIP